MLEFLKRDRTPRTLMITAALAWVVTLLTRQARTPETDPWLSFVMAAVMVIGLIVVGFVLVRVFLIAFKR